MSDTHEQDILVRRIWKQSLLAGDMELSICGTATRNDIEDIVAILELTIKQLKRDYLDKSEVCEAMTPTSKADGARERARQYLVDRAEIGWPEDKVVGFAESEAALARKEEREAILKIVRNSGVEAGTWGEEAVRDEITSEIRKRSQEEGR